ncbi:biopolymer transporter ExbD [Bacteriovoracaceae bacterium]|nr:biopolymer transporter ExbD [Bacteriovoracaceae bacterium]|tara:strand:+ start:155928 stop:156440 length:513 start_codon:yes stop_codon:yes gene_type:complete
MRKSRSIRNRGRRPKKAILDLDITSLLDILVIMLVFLLKSYNSSGIVINVPKGLSLPESVSSSMNTAGVIVQVSPDTIWVDDKEIINKVKTPLSRITNANRGIYPLYNELVKKKQLIKQVEKSSPEAQKFSGVVNLIIDKTLKYSEIKTILHTCAEAGFKTYKFVVLGEE